MKSENLDYSPSFWLVLVIIVPCIVALELLIAFDELRGAEWTRPSK